MSYEEDREIIFRKVEVFSGEGFEALALEVFRFQATHNGLYARYLSLLNVDPWRVNALAGIPFLPIQFFKSHDVKTGHWEAADVFTSSGTTGERTSRHLVRDLDFYKKNTVKGFRTFYGAPSDYLILALLPSYLERSGSSLVAMADHFIGLSRHAQSGFFLDDTASLVKALHMAGEVPVLLLGVSFALLDLAEGPPFDWAGPGLVMETGGMKGRRRELTRPELHQVLAQAFQRPLIHSEYGMTELFSQAYSQGEGLFRSAPTMCALAREITDPLSPQKTGRIGVLNIVDLANFDTCSFIATDDLGKVWPDGSFEVLGRADHSDIRGCNLMVG